MAVVEVRCSAGTYVRSLARDLGDRLGCGAYLGALTRTASGPFTLESAHPLDVVREELAAGRIEPLLLPLDAGLSDIPSLRLVARDRGALGRGQVVKLRTTVDLGERRDAQPGAAGTAAPSGSEVPDPAAPGALDSAESGAPDPAEPGAADAAAPEGPKPAAQGRDPSGAPDAGARDPQGTATLASPSAADLVRVVDESGRLVAMAHVRDGRLYPDKVFVSPEP
jgi:tRNA U55 pseudouridine synthase TruB